MFDFQSETVVPIHLSLAWTRGCLSSNAFFYVWFSRSSLPGAGVDFHLRIPLAEDKSRGKGEAKMIIDARCN